MNGYSRPRGQQGTVGWRPESLRRPPAPGNTIARARALAIDSQEEQGKRRQGRLAKSGGEFSSWRVSSIILRSNKTTHSIGKTWDQPPDVGGSEFPQTTGPR